MSDKKDLQVAVKIAGKIDKSLKDATGMTQRELKKIARDARKEIYGTSAYYKQRISDINGSIQNTGIVANKVFDGMKIAAMAAGAAIGAIGVASIGIGKEYESQMSSVQAITGATGSDMELLKNKAKEMGETTVFSATEAGKAMEYMAMAGWKTEDMLDGIEGIMNLAAASGEDLATTSDIVTDALTAFGLKAEDASHFSDVLAVASSNANTNVAMMGETFTYAASVAGSLGYDVEDVATSIGLMANAGIKASQAGTALRKIMTQTAQGIKLSAGAFGEMNIETDDGTGKMREWSDIVDDLRKSFAQMTEQEKALNAENISGKTGMAGLLAIVNASEADYRKLTSAIENADGAAEKMAQTRLDNLEGDLKLAESAAQGLGIELYEELSPTLREIVKWGTKQLSGISKNFTNMAKDGKRAFKTLASAVEPFTKPFMEIAKWAADNPATLANIFISVGEALVAYKVVAGVSSMVNALKDLTTGGMIGLGLTVVGGGILYIANAMHQAAEEAKYASLDAHFGDLSYSMEELQNAAERMVASRSLEQAREAIKALGELGNIQGKIDTASDTLNKTAWKISIGLELTEEEKSAYQASVTDFIEEENNYLNQSQYSVNLAINAIMGEDGSDLVDSLNSFYDNKRGELADAGKRLNKAITDAFQDGLLEIDEAKKVAEIQQEMASIQAQIAAGKFEGSMEALKIEYGGGAMDAESFEQFQAELAEQAQKAKETYREAFETAYGAAIASKEDYLQEGNTLESFNNNLKELERSYLENVAAVEERINSFQANTLKETYADVLDSDMYAGINKAVKDTITDAFETTAAEDNFVNYGDTVWTQMIGAIQTAAEKHVGSDDQDAIAELVDSMRPSAEQLEGLADEYRSMGETVPESIMEGIREYKMIGAAAGDEESIWWLMSDEIANNEDYAEMLEKLKAEGANIPDEIMKGIKANQSAIDNGAKDLFLYSEKAFKKAFEKEIKVPVNVATYFNQFGKSAGNDSFSGSAKNYLGGKVQRNAEGGIITSPILTTFAEEGPEAAIPLDGSQRAISLWQRAGEILGTLNKPSRAQMLADKLDTPSQSSQTSQTFTYAPVHNFYGNTTGQDVLDAERQAQEEFERRMAKFMKNNKRISFA